MNYFPLFLNLHDQHCLVVGGGDVAARKIRLLAAAGGKITVVAPQLCEELVQAVLDNKLVYLAASFNESQLQNTRLVIAATNSEEVNRHVFEACEARGILVNAVDDPGSCRFITPAIVDRSPLMIAISTSGGVPVLARQLRSQLEALIPHGYGDLAQMASDFREEVKQTLTSVDARKQFWEKTLAGPIPDMVFAGQHAAARQAFSAAIKADADAPVQGAVYLVGCGPGNPDLLTFRALRLMQQADVVLYDNLVSAPILEMVRRDAERVYVGKKSNNHAVRQEEINQLLVRYALQGKKVLRLKGGDPFIFGRGGEEIEELAGAGVAFEVVPGITSAAGASCYAGIPLTHRDYAQSVTFVTGHRRDGEVELDWPRLVSPTETVVVYMGVAQVEKICAQLIKHGRNPDTPAAMVEKATLSKQRVVVGTLSNLAQKVLDQGIKPPALIIIGEVVSLHDKLKWLAD
ncbi:siroheme synthase CysG [Iodobacter fluviatilis]|uniref:Siroheme synthase n=1 Tax=Iodobacter fluviatilis TaxID=537 RepID=A0A377Q6H5_9NEIS|nr:siroheme synthase CysG [Iodobacter fluviatilis]TCU87026.1 uroporphyrinogen-III C-methyltransferase /precorrin-2 dehydrogenase [Iodobacter fluviatilis]STQ90358.1 Siroheme synthase [Iodobacter fluviatilis]